MHVNYIAHARQKHASFDTIYSILYNEDFLLFY